MHVRVIRVPLSVTLLQTEEKKEEKASRRRVLGEH